MRQLSKLNPLKWGWTLLLGIMLVIGLNSGSVQPEQIGSVVRQSAELGLDTLRGVLVGLGISL